MESRNQLEEQVESLATDTSKRFRVISDLSKLTVFGGYLYGSAKLFENLAFNHPKEFDPLMLPYIVGTVAGWVGIFTLLERAENYVYTTLYNRDSQ